MMQKPGTPSSMPSKSVIFGWIKQIMPDVSITKMKVQELGDGVIYCRIMNHYFPSSVNLNRLNLNPKNQYEYSLNLKLFQNGLTQHKITVPFDVSKIAKQKFLQNWGLINSLYRHLVSNNNNEQSVIGEDSKSMSQIGPKHTPKRSFEAAFPHQQITKQVDSHSFLKPIYSQTTQPTVHYQNNLNYQGSQNYSASAINLHPLPMQSISNLQNSLYNSNSTGSHLQVNTHNNPQTYQNTGLNQSAFGGFNFGMNNHSIGSSNNQLGSINQRSLLPSQNRQSMIYQMNKTSNLPFNQQIQGNKCWSVGKLPSRQSLSLFGISAPQNSGKYSVNSHIFQNNYNAVIDRVKQILLKNSHDIQKIRQIKMLLSIPLNEDIVKIEEEENIMTNCNNQSKNNSSSNKKSAQKDLKINSKQTIQSQRQRIEGSKQNIDLFQSKKTSQQISNASQKIADKGSSSLQNNSVSQNSCKKESYPVKIPQSSGKKIRNNFFGQGSVFRK